MVIRKYVMARGSSCVKQRGTAGLRRVAVTGLSVTQCVVSLLPGTYLFFP